MTSSRILLAALLACGLLAPAALPARAASSLPALADGLAFTRLPVGVREQAAGGIYGDYDFFRIFSNPALLGWQPRTWDAGIGGGAQFGSLKGLFSYGGSWASQPGDNGSFGAAGLLSLFTVPAFKRVDLDGQESGPAITPTGSHLAIAAAYQWDLLAVGAGVRYARMSYGSWLSDTTALLFDAGFAVRFKRLEFGAAFVRLGGSPASPGAFNYGGALTVKRVTVTGMASVTVPGAAGTKAGNMWTDAYTGGVSVNVIPPLTLRMALKTQPGGLSGAAALGTSLRAGLTFHMDKDSAIDYAVALPLGSGMGVTHLVSIEFRGGKERRLTEGEVMKFFFEEKGRGLAVANFDAQEVSASDASVISDLFRTEMVKVGSFDVVEKASMERVLQEQAFQQTGCTTQECAVKLGRILNVQYLVLGSVGKLFGSYVITIRVVKVETGKIIYSDAEQNLSQADVAAAIHTLSARLAEAVKKSK
ncbi:MAG: CsgG/HfaB family protein [Candidatus Coatesbacteria bacterium]